MRFVPSRQRPGGQAWRLWPALLWALLPGLLPGLVSAQTTEVSEYSMKAVLYYRLSQFVYWPGQQAAPTPTVLCVIGRNPFSSALGQIDKNNPKIELRIVHNDLSPCQMVFIPRSEAGQLNSWLERAHGRNVVTVSDISGFARNGGMIELPLEGERIAIVLNRRVAQKQGFEFSAQLLRLARVIE